MHPILAARRHTEGCDHALPSGIKVQNRGMEFFCYHRDRRGSSALRNELLQEHWSYMDRYAAGMIARGPTFADHDGTPTGSVHIVDMPDAAAARTFAFDEPNYQAGAYRDVQLRRWRNLLGRTMWDFPGGRDGGNRYLVLGLGAEQAAELAVPPNRDELIAYGPCCCARQTRTRHAPSWHRTGTPRPRCTPGRSADGRHE
jgi:uncharacterized protein YciI